MSDVPKGTGPEERERRHHAKTDGAPVAGRFRASVVAVYVHRIGWSEVETVHLELARLMDVEEHCRRVLRVAMTNPSMLGAMAVGVSGHMAHEEAKDLLQLGATLMRLPGRIGDLHCAGEAANIIRRADAAKVVT